MKLPRFLLGSIIAGGMALAVLTGASVAASVTVNDPGVENICQLNMGMTAAAMCPTDLPAIPTDAIAQTAMANQVDGFDTPQIGVSLDNGLYFGAKSMTPAKKLLFSPTPTDVADLLSCSDEIIAAAAIDIMVPLPEELTDVTAMADTCISDWDVGLRTPT